MAILQSTYRFRFRDCPTASVGRVESAFPQWDKMMSLLRVMARQSAADYAQRKIVHIIPKTGVVYPVVDLLSLKEGKEVKGFSMA